MYERLGEIKRHHENKIFGLTLHSKDIDWLIEQAEKLNEIKQTFYDENTNVVDCYRKQIEIFEGKKTNRD